jgi:hypothetical protein
MSTLHSTPRFKKTIACVLLHLGLMTSCFASDWSQPYSPTRGEWLTYEVKRDIEQLTDLWSNRVALIVAVDPKKQAVDILISTVGQQALPAGQNCELHKPAIEQRARRTLRQFDWSMNGQVFVTCL